MEWLQMLFGFLAGGGAIGIAGFFTLRSTIRKARVDADKAADDRYREQIDHQQQTVDKLLAQCDSFAARLSSNNSTIDKHVDRNRELTDRIAVLTNEKLVLVRENEALKRLTDFLHRWHCGRPYSDCQRRKPEQQIKEDYRPPVELISVLAATETTSESEEENEKN